MPLNKIKIDMALVFSAGVLWSTVGIGVRLIETANVWQILLYRSMSLSVFLLLIIACLKKSNPIKSLINTGYAGLIGGFALLAAYSGGIYSILTPDSIDKVIATLTDDFSMAFLTSVIGLPLSAVFRTVLIVLNASMALGKTPEAMPKSGARQDFRYCNVRSTFWRALQSCHIPQGPSKPSLARLRHCASLFGGTCACSMLSFV